MVFFLPETLALEFFDSLNPCKVNDFQTSDESIQRRSDTHGLLVQPIPVAAIKL